MRLPIVEADAIVDPWAVVVHIQNTSFADGAVMGAEGEGREDRGRIKILSSKKFSLKYKNCPRCTLIVIKFPAKHYSVISINVQ
jgi:hypothetical protein